MAGASCASPAAMPRGYGHLKDAHVVVLEQHPV
jgi:hypothetical protein